MEKCGQCVEKCGHQNVYAASTTPNLEASIDREASG